jgi:DNA-binding winged helix-turn-helix (wHTH) protein
MEMSTSGRPGNPVALHEPTRELLHGGARIRLQEQPFQILKTLLARPGAVVTREMLRDQLWPQGTFVDFEHSLNAAVKRLRAALGDDAREPKFIETLPRRGYRWITRQSARLAIAPFTIHDGDDLFGRGLAEELKVQIALCGAGRVQLIGRASLPCADYVLEGGIRRQGERVRVAAWLVDARDDVQTWSDVYERQITEPLPAQIDMAAHIARAIIEILPAA